MLAAICIDGGIILFPRRKFSFGKKLAQRGTSFKRRSPIFYGIQVVVRCLVTSYIKTEAAQLTLKDVA